MRLSGSFEEFANSFRSRSGTPARTSQDAEVGSTRSYSSVPPLKRPTNVPLAASFERQEGFSLAPRTPTAVPLERPAQRNPSPSGLLTRQFSKENIPSGLSSNVIPLPSGFRVKPSEREQSPPTKQSPPKDPSSVDQELLRLQIAYPVFKSAVVIRAYAVARSAFSGRSRKDGSSMLSHCVQTATILAELGLDAETVATGLVHDVLDDTNLLEEQLRRVLPTQVVDRVVSVTRMSEYCHLYRTRYEAETLPLDPHLATKLKSLLLGMSDVRTVLVKLADRLHNMRTLSALPPAKQQRIAEETLQIFAPLANRLGVWSLKAELEDLCLKALFPEEYRELHARLEGPTQRTRIEQTLNSLKASLEARGIAYEDLSGRPKNLFGVFQKMVKKGYSVDQIHDLRAARIIVRSKEDCYRALREVHNTFEAVHGKTKDYIREPKENGYQSLHTVVMGTDGQPIEIQIRTHKMHYLAEYGVAAHWRYKEQLEASSEFEQQQVAWARFLCTWHLELDDKKCRPAGSPPRDNSLASISMDPDTDTSRCTFPTHAADCRFAHYLRSANLAPTPPSASGATTSPIYLVVMRNGTLHVRDVPAGSTARDLVEGGILSDLIDSRSRVLVNEHTVFGSDAVLLTGDKVEIFSERGAGDLLYFPIGGDGAVEVGQALGVPVKMDATRRRLNRIYHNSVQAAAL